MGLFDEASIKKKIHKLTSKKTDLMDDSNSINDINKKINNAIDDVEAFFVRGNRQICSKLEGYKEPCQYNDGNLQSAANCIQQEIDYLNKKLATGGGGGSW